MTKGCRISSQQQRCRHAHRAHSRSLLRVRSPRRVRRRLVEHHHGANDGRRRAQLSYQSRTSSRFGLHSTIPLKLPLTVSLAAKFAMSTKITQVVEFSTELAPKHKHQALGVSINELATTRASKAETFRQKGSHRQHSKRVSTH